MVSPAQIQTQAYSFKQDTALGRWSWTTVMDVSGVSPAFKVTDIRTPFGLYRDTTPIPGEIVEAMGASILQIRTQFQPAILVGPPTTITFEITEGLGYSEAQEASVTNNGAYGSLLAAALATSASYVSVNPTIVGALAVNSVGTFEVVVDSTALTADDSPYTETVTVQDASAVNSPQTLTVVINVLPKATIEASPTSLTFNAVRPLSGPFDPIATQTFAVTNDGPAGSVLEWQIQRDGNSPWLASYTPVSGTLESGESATITLTVVPATNTLVGQYTAALRISGYSTNDYVSVGLTLNVT